MSKIIKITRHHILTLLDEPMNRHLKAFFTEAQISKLEHTNSVSIIYNNKIVACGGITEVWAGRGIVWTVFSECSKQHFVPTFRAIRRWLHEQINEKYNRIEVSVDYGFETGRRRVELLGFSLECERAKKYLPSGEDCSIYSLVRE